MIQIEREQFPTAASHGADAFLTFACSDCQPPRPYKPRGGAGLGGLAI
jgi:hypothetical protein